MKPPQRFDDSAKIGTGRNGEGTKKYRDGPASIDAAFYRCRVLLMPGSIDNGRIASAPCIARRISRRLRRRFCRTRSGLASSALCISAVPTRSLIALPGPPPDIISRAAPGLLPRSNGDATDGPAAPSRNPRMGRLVFYVAALLA